MEGIFPVSQQGCRAVPSGQRALSHLQRIKEPSSDSKISIKQSGLRRKQYKANIFFIIFAPKLLSMTLQKWSKNH